MFSIIRRFLDFDPSRGFGEISPPSVPISYSILCKVNILDSSYPPLDPKASLSGLPPKSCLGRAMA